MNRVFMAAPGTYDVYVAMKERLPEKAPKTQVPKMGVFKTQVTVPDFWNGELATSSIIVTDKVNVLNAPPNPEEGRERPFVFGSQELVPASDLEFKKSEQLATFFQVYNAGLGTDGKPDILMEYNFHRKENGAEKFFNKTNPQTINASNLPPTFDPTQVPGAGRDRGAAVELPRRRLPPGNQDQRQGGGQNVDERHAISLSRALRLTGSQGAGRSPLKHLGLRHLGTPEPWNGSDFLIPKCGKIRAGLSFERHPCDARGLR